MATLMSLRVGDRACTFELFEDAAPGLCAALRRATPHTSIAVHCQTAGAEFCLPLPFFHWHENRRVPVAGDVGYASFNNYLCVYYGEMDPDDGPTNLIGRVVGGADAVRAIGGALLERGAAVAHLAVVGVETPDAALPPPPEPVTAFTPVARAYLESTLRGMPAEIERLRQLPRLAMGNVAARFQAAGALLALSESLLLCRLQALQGDIPLSCVVSAATMAARRYTRSLAMLGLGQSAAVMRELAEWLEDAGPASAPEFVASTEEVLVALGRMRLWADAVAPWQHLTRDYLPDQRWLGDLAEVKSAAST
jgi:hypothetical protein